MNHTPAPWVVTPGRDKTHPHNVESRSPDCDGFDLARCVNAADAALIAAAPDLLAALIEAAEIIESTGLDASPARAAIAKAKGQA